VVDGGLGDDTEGLWRDPLPKDDLLVHEMSFQLLLCPDVEYLELASSYKGIERACRSACQNAPVFMHKWKGTAAAEGSRVLLSLEFSPPGCTRFPASLRFVSTARGKDDLPLRAKIFSFGCMMAESAVIGRLMTELASLRSTMTTLFWSLTQMKASDSRVSVWNEIEAGWMPRAVS
jgi:hypothetical protein